MKNNWSDSFTQIPQTTTHPLTPPPYAPSREQLMEEQITLLTGAVADLATELLAMSPAAGPIREKINRVLEIRKML